MTDYVEPPVVVTGQTMTAANWNAWVVDVAKAMWVYTAAGQIAYSTAANALAALSKPSVDSILKMTSAGEPSWKALTEFAALIYRRQGGSATNWNTFGSTNYTPTDPKIQVGVTRFVVPDNATNNMSATITFPTSFTYTPIVFVTTFTNSNHDVSGATPPCPGAEDVTTTTVLITIKSTAGNFYNGSVFTIAWMAIGQ